MFEKLELLKEKLVVPIKEEVLEVKPEEKTEDSEKPIV